MRCRARPLSAASEITVVGEASTGEGAIDMVGEHAPDVVVIDMVMPGIGGLEAIKRLRAAHPGLGILALTSFSERSRIQDAHKIRKCAEVGEAKRLE